MLGYPLVEMRLSNGMGMLRRVSGTVPDNAICQQARWGLRQKVRCDPRRMQVGGQV